MQNFGFINWYEKYLVEAEWNITKKVFLEFLKDWGCVPVKGKVHQKYLCPSLNPKAISGKCQIQMSENYGKDIRPKELTNDLNRLGAKDKFKEWMFKNKGRQF